MFMVITDAIVLWSSGENSGWPRLKEFLHCGVSQSFFFTDSICFVIHILVYYTAFPHIPLFMK